MTASAHKGKGVAMYGPESWEGEVVAGQEADRQVDQRIRVHCGWGEAGYGEWLRWRK